VVRRQQAEGFSINVRLAGGGFAANTDEKERSAFVVADSSSGEHGRR